MTCCVQPTTTSRASEVSTTAPPISHLGTQLDVGTQLDLAPKDVDVARLEGIDLFFAAAEGSTDKVKVLLDARVDPNFRDYEQRCPLHIAARAGTNLEVINLLITAGADVNAMDVWSQTPLDLSQQGAYYKVEQLLKKKGAKLPKGSMQKRSVREKWEIKRSDVQIGAEISKTLKSSVHRATWNGVDVVAKFVLPESDMTPEEAENEMLHEISLIATMKHPDLVMFLGCCLQESPIMFITQFMPGGDLENYYKAKRLALGDGRLWAPGVTVVNRWARAICRGLTFLHNGSQPIIHRDLKPLNILLTESLEVKLTDFGISKSMRPRDRCSVANASVAEKTSPPNVASPGGARASRMSFVMTGGVGSWAYMAPEVARYQNYTEKIDIYAFGLILYFMSCGRQPFHEYKDVREVLDLYNRGEDPRPKSSHCPKCFRPIMEAAWHKVPGQRPPAAELGERLIEIHSNSTNCTGCVVA